MELHVRTTPRQPALVPKQTVIEANELAFSALVAEPETAGDTAPLALLIHGFPDVNATFAPQLDALAAAGYRAVAPLLRGYEESSQPPSKGESTYHPLHAAEDTLALARLLGSDAPVHLVGHDWGALVACLAAAAEPDRWASVATIAVPPPRLHDAIGLVPAQLAKSWYVFFFQLRGLSDAAVRADGFAFVERLWRAWSPGWRWDPSHLDAVKAQLARPGVLKAALSYYRAVANPFSDPARRAAALLARPAEIPILAVTGARDGCIDTRLYDRIADRSVTVERVDGCGHFAHLERPDALNELLLGWMSGRRDLGWRPAPKGG